MWDSFLCDGFVEVFQSKLLFDCSVETRNKNKMSIRIFLCWLGHSKYFCFTATASSKHSVFFYYFWYMLFLQCKRLSKYSIGLFAVVGKNSGLKGCQSYRMDCPLACKCVGGKQRIYLEWP